MRIACIATSLVPSTTANSIQVVKACHALKQIGHDVNLFIPGSEEANWEDIEELYGLKERFRFIWIRSIDFLRRYDFAITSVLRSFIGRTDIVYTWMIQAAVMAQFLDLPVILELHDSPTGRFAPSLFKILLRMGGRKRVLVITRALLNRLQDQYDENQLSRYVQISPNGTELDVYDGLPEARKARERLGLPSTFTAVYTGHFYIGRGMNLLFNLAKELPEVNFMWVGGQPEKVKYWREEIQKAQLNNVILTGCVSKKELPLYQAAGDILLMPYENIIEGSSGGNTVDICSPMKMFDYLAAGRPIISSDLPVIHEVLNYKNAVFCSPNDVGAWKSAITMLKNDTEKQKLLANHALMDIKKFTWVNRAQNAVSDFL